jgi:hypothetical protein
LITAGVVAFVALVGACSSERSIPPPPDAGKSTPVSVRLEIEVTDSGDGD